MGDRGNIVVRQAKDTNRDDVWFYTHWKGSNIKEIARSAVLVGEERWDDPSYFARVVFQELVAGKNGLTGFGISCQMQDNQHPILVLDTTSKHVYTVPEGAIQNRRLPNLLGSGFEPETFAVFSREAA